MTKDQLRELLSEKQEQLRVAREYIDYTVSSSGWAVAALEEEIREIKKQLK